VRSVSLAEAAGRRERPGKAAIMRAAVEVMGEDGYEGASMRDMAARAGVSVAALYYHFPSKLDLLREFLDEAYDVTRNRIDRRLAALPSSKPVDRLDEIVSTLIASHLHDEWAQLASNVAFREYTRLNPPERKAIDKKRQSLLQLVARVIEAGVEAGEFATEEPREAARAIITLSTSLVEPFGEMKRSMHDVIELYQGFARAIARG
jgi:AcrR family transcriptional regulator